MFVREVVGEGSVMKKLLQMILAGGSDMIRIHHAADPNQISRVKLCYCCADRSNTIACSVLRRCAT